MRRGGYAALRVEEKPAAPPVECELDPDCLARRTVTVREGAPAVGLTVGQLPLLVERLRRNGTEWASPSREEVVRPGDELVLAGTSEAFARTAPLFRVGPIEPVALETALADTGTVVDVEQAVELHASPGTGCTHVGETHRVTPSAPGCEDCLRTGDRWVHLRICMTCGHAGCCDSSPNKHATAHFRAVGHPIIKSLEPGEDWGWCYVDEVTL